MAPYFSPPFLEVARQLLSLWYIIYFNVPWNDWSPNKQVCMFSRSQSEHTCGFGPLQTDLGGAHSHLEIRVFFWGLKVWICLRWLLKLSTMGFIIIEPPFCFFPTTLSKSKVREEITRSLSWCWSWMFFFVCVVLQIRSPGIHHHETNHHFREKMVGSLFRGIKLPANPRKNNHLAFSVAICRRGADRNLCKDVIIKKGHFPACKCEKKHI